MTHATGGAVSDDEEDEDAAERGHHDDVTMKMTRAAREGASMEVGASF